MYNIYMYMYTYYTHYTYTPFIDAVNSVKKYKSNSCKLLRKSLSILQGSALLSRLLLVRPRLGHARLGAHQELELAHDTIRCYDHHDQDHWSNEELISQRQKA